MIKTLGVILTVVGILGLTFGVLGIFGSNIVALHPWAMAILGLIFFTSGVGLLKKSESQS